MTRRWLLAFVVFTAACGAAAAQTLGVSDGRLTVNGTPRFLVFISYFDAMRRADAGGGAPAFDEDFQFFRGTVDGIRILVNWCRREPGRCEPADDGLFTAAGEIQDAAHWSQPSMSPWDRFVTVLGAAKAHGLLVNVTFTRETLQPHPPLEVYGNAIARVIARLEAEHPGQFRHVFFDLQNEFTKSLDLFTVPALKQLVTKARGARAGALITASQESQTPAQAAARARDAGLDLLAFHDCRGCDGWYTAAKIGGDAWALTSTAGERPVIYDEPPGYCEPGVSREPCHDGDSADGDQFVAAAANARGAGVSMWTFHTREAFDLRRGSYVSRASAAERTILRNIRQRLGVPATSSR